MIGKVSKANSLELEPTLGETMLNWKLKDWASFIRCSMNCQSPTINNLRKIPREKNLSKTYIKRLTII